MTWNIICGDCLDVMHKMTKPVDLIVTSPPYYNAKREYATYDTYAEYMEFLSECYGAMHRILKDGRFLVSITSPVITPRISRNTNSKRHAIPFDQHGLLIAAGFDFIDDIIWVKPEGSAVGRVRRFELDRKPLQYKSAPVAEYVMVYRRRTDRTTESMVKQYPEDVIARSLVLEYNRTNIWHINPESSEEHPAVFPLDLADRVIRLYSMYGDTVLDPFAGSGTACLAAARLGRNSIGIDKSPKYCLAAKRRLKTIQVTLETAA